MSDDEEDEDLERVFVALNGGTLGSGLLSLLMVSFRLCCSV